MTKRNFTSFSALVEDSGRVHGFGSIVQCSSERALGWQCWDLHRDEYNVKQVYCQYQRPV
jgi:hypothetical protein